MDQVLTAAACGDMLGESPVWSVREQALYWVDLRAPALHRLADGTHRTWPMPELCCGAVLSRSGLVPAFPQWLMRFDPGRGTLAKLHQVEPDSLGNRLNEAKCDRAGRLWVGSMRDYGAAVTGALYRVGPGLQQDRMLTGITVPNSLGWSPDGRTMYFADTREEFIRAYDFELGSGAIGAMRVLVPAGSLSGRPDGCTVDSTGHVWSARFGGSCVVRLAPDGQVRQTIGLPVSQPTSCALGGPDLRTLYVTSARQRLAPEQFEIEPQAGHLFAIQVDVPGLPEAAFDCGDDGFRT